MENSSFGLVVGELLCNVIILIMGVKRLQTIIVPCIEPFLHLIMTQFHGDDRKGSKLLLAILVEKTVGIELLVGHGFPGGLEGLDVLNYDLGHDELCLPIVSGIHVSSSLSDFPDAFVVLFGQTLKISVDLLLLADYLLDLRFEVNI